MRTPSTPGVTRQDSGVAASATRPPAPGRVASAPLGPPQRLPAVRCHRDTGSSRVWAWPPRLGRWVFWYFDVNGNTVDSPSLESSDAATRDFHAATPDLTSGQGQPGFRPQAHDRYGQQRELGHRGRQVHRRRNSRRRGVCAGLPAGGDRAIAVRQPVLHKRRTS